MASPHARVLRDGIPKEIDATGVVPGDVLVLETGARVAADARLISAEELEVDESALTGESVPVAKKVGVLDRDTSLADRKNMVYMSTSVTGGRSLAVVVATGMRTEIGKIAAQVSATEREETPLQKRMHKLGIVIGVAGIVLAAFVFILGLLRSYRPAEMLMFSVAVAVSAIPEGLPAVISVTLALGVRRMASRNALIRRLPAVETLGSVTVICSDKTGTITKNQMTVKRVWAGGRIYEFTGEGYTPEGEIKTEGGEKLEELPDDLKKLLEIGLFCNNAVLKKKEGQWVVEGNPSEGALIVAAMKAGLEKTAEKEERLSEIPFSSNAKYMATLHPDRESGGRVAYVKGDPERILEFCSHVLKDGQPVELDETLRKEIEGINEDFASKALRVMAGAYRKFGDKEKLERSDVEEGWYLSGFGG
jgi:Ca2+-transporting ATPase